MGRVFKLFLSVTISLRYDVNFSRYWKEICKLTSIQNDHQFIYVSFCHFTVVLESLTVNPYSFSVVKGYYDYPLTTPFRMICLQIVIHSYQKK